MEARLATWSSHLAGPSSGPQSQARKSTSRRVVDRVPDPRQRALFDLPLPGWIEPCLATLVSKAPTGPQWVHEIKWDGYRLSAYIKDGEVTLRTRRGHNWTDRFPAIAEALAGLSIYSAVLDGEAVVLDEQGRSDFGALQAVLGKAGRGTADPRCSMPSIFSSSTATTCAIGSSKGAAMLGDGAGPHEPDHHASEEIDGDGATIFRHACNHGLERIVSTRSDAPYRSGRRNEWRKTKCVQSDANPGETFQPS